MTAEIIVYFLGTDERKNTQLYPIRQLVTVGYIDNVLHNHVAHFKDESEAVGKYLFGESAICILHKQRYSRG